MTEGGDAKPNEYNERNGAPGRIRIPNLLIRSQNFYVSP